MAVATMHDVGRPSGQHVLNRLANDAGSDDTELLHRKVTFVAADPPRHSFFACWDDQHRGGLGTSSSVDVEVVLPETPALQRVAAERIDIRAAIDPLAALRIDQPADATAHSWAAVVRMALALIAEGKVLPWVSPAGNDAWRVDPLDRRDLLAVRTLADALPVHAHATPGPTTSTIADAEFTIRAVFDAVADAFLRTPAAHRVGSLSLFADRDATQVPHLRPWVENIAETHCAASRLVLRMHPPEDDDDDWTVTFALQSTADPSLLVDAADYWHAPSEVIDRLGTSAETTLLAGLLKASRLIDPWNSLIDDLAPTAATLDDDGIETLLEQLDELEAANIEVRWPSALIAPKIERRAVVSAGAPGSHRSGGLTLDSVVDVDWQFLLDGVELSAEELAVLAAAKRSVVSIRGRWVRLDRATIEQLRAPAPKLNLAGALAAALDESLEIEASDTDDVAIGPIPITAKGALGELIERLDELQGQREESEPPNLNAELRAYQRRGLAWLSDICELGLGGCLADDMGLGKTIQILALHDARRAQGASGPTLVVCPTTLMRNWAREAEKFVPDYPVTIFHGPRRSLDHLNDGDFGNDAIVITSYGVVRSDAELLDEYDWDLVVADEAQHAKNPRSRTARALRLIDGGIRLALTGTPVENNLSELWSIIDWCMPGLLGPLATFRRTMALPIERDGDRQATARLQRRIRPFLLRRTKADEGIAPELPDKIERDVIVTLSDEQVTLYRATVDEALAEIATAEGIGRRGLILKLLTALKQITNHPAHFLGEAGPTTERSGKLEALDELLDAAAASQSSTVIFTQYVAMARLLVEHEDRRGLSIDMLHGGLSVARRQQLIDRFQDGDLDVLVLSLKAGGTGLNLTKATNVVHYDRWWNPAVEDQATDRAYRIGQTQTVTVHRLIAEGTVEDRVAELLKAKRQLASTITSAGESWIGDLDDDDLAELVELATEVA